MQPLCRVCICLWHHRCNVIQRIVLVGRVFQHPTALQLVVYPICIVEVGGIMLVDGIAEDDFEDVQHTIEFLTQL